MTRGIDRRRFAVGSAGLIAAAGAAAAPRQQRRGARRQRAARPVRVRRDRLRSGPGERPLLVPCHRPHLRGAARLRPAGDAGAAGAADGRSAARGLGRLHASGRVRLQRGIRFADDAGLQRPAARARRRRLRLFVQAHLRPGAEEPGATARSTRTASSASRSSRARALRDKKPFDYDSVVEGVRALDRYTIQFKLAKPRPRFATTLAASTYAAMAREVVDAYRGDIMAHPVGTGPYRLKAWRRSSRILLEQEPGLTATSATRASPPPDDAEGQAWAKRFNGRRLPLNDGVEIAVVAGKPAALAELPERRGRLRARAARAVAARRCRTASWRPISPGRASACSAT